MDITEFAEQFKALLRKAEDSGIPVEEFCSIAEHIIAQGWGDDNLVTESE